MDKSDLEFGNVVELKNGMLCLIEPTYNHKGSSVEDYLIGASEHNVQFRNIKNAQLELCLSDCYSDLTATACLDDCTIIKVYEDYTLKNLLWERKEALLTDEEREWLSAVIKPFKDEVECVVLEKSGYKDKIGYLTIRLQNNDEFFTPYLDKLPFKFKGLELDKAYTLEELGL